MSLSEQDMEREADRTIEIVRALSEGTMKIRRRVPIVPLGSIKKKTTKQDWSNAELLADAGRLVSNHLKWRQREQARRDAEQSQGPS